MSEEWHSLVGSGIYRFWQEGNDAQEIYLNDYFNQKLNYIHNNPVKAEIVDRAEVELNPHNN
jgi:hypothetical protein